MTVLPRDARAYPVAAADVDTGAFLQSSPRSADRQIAELIELSTCDATCIERALEAGN